MAAGAALFVLAVVAACGGSSSGGATSTSESAGGTSAGGTSASGTSTVSALPSEYDGPEASFPEAYPVPVKEPGFTFTVGYLNNNAVVRSLTVAQQGAEAMVKELGGTFIAKDAGDKANKQVSQFNELLVAGVDAILMYPQNPNAMTPSLERANELGIPVVGLNTPADPTEPLLSGYLTAIGNGRDKPAYLQMQALAEVAPGSSFALIGSAEPNPALVYIMDRYEYWGIQFGLKFLGEVDAQSGDPIAASAAMSALLARYPDVQAVLTWSDPSALAAFTVAQSSGRDDVRVCGFGGEEAAIESIRADGLFCTWLVDWTELGRQMATAAYDDLTDQGLPLPERTQAPGLVVTAENADDVEGV